MRSKWLDISQVLLSLLMNRDIVEVHKNENKKQTKQKKQKRNSHIEQTGLVKKELLYSKKIFFY